MVLKHELLQRQMEDTSLVLKEKSFPKSMGPSVRTDNEESLEIKKSLGYVMIKLQISMWRYIAAISGPSKSF